HDTQSAASAQHSPADRQSQPAGRAGRLVEHTTNVVERVAGNDRGGGYWRTGGIICLGFGWYWDRLWHDIRYGHRNNHAGGCGPCTPVWCPTPQDLPEH